MSNKTFTVTHPKARAPIVVKGATLDEALEKEGLDPAVWKEQGSALEEEDNGDPETGGAPGSEDN